MLEVTDGFKFYFVYVNECALCVCVCVGFLFLLSFSSSRVRDDGMAAHSFLIAENASSFHRSLHVNTDLSIALGRSDLRLPFEFLTERRIERLFTICLSERLFSAQAWFHFLPFPLPLPFPESLALSCLTSFVGLAFFCCRVRTERERFMKSIQW